MFKVLSAAAVAGVLMFAGTAVPASAAPVEKGIQQHKATDVSSAKRRVARRHIHRRIVRRPLHPYYGYRAAPYYAYRPAPYYGYRPAPYYRPYYAYGGGYPYYRPYGAYAPVPFLPFGIGFGYGARYW